MKQEHRDIIIFYILLAMKVLTTIRTGWDTFIVSRDVLNVVLLDGAFFGLWLMLAYGGKGQLALRIRPFAAGGAYLMYALMLVIGWEAHADTPLVALAVRIAGGLLLAYDSWDFIMTWRQRREENQKTLAEEQRDMRKGMWRRVYQKQLKRAENEFDIQVTKHIQSDMLTDGDLWASLPALVETRRALPSGKSVPDDRERPRTTANVTVVNKQFWSELFPDLPDRFTRAVLEEMCGCGKTSAVGLINLGKSQGDIVEIARGTYQKVQTGEIVEDTDTSPTEGF